MAREILSDENGRATAVSYIDKKTRTERQIRCPGRGAGRQRLRVGAPACSTPGPAAFPQGLANNSGVVGRFLMDTVGLGVGGYVPALEGMPHYDTDGFSGGHVYSPWWEWDKKNKDFPRGIPHRDRRRVRNAGRRQLPGPSGPNRRLRTAAQGPDPQESMEPSWHLRAGAR